MLAASARTLAARDPQALAELARELGVPVAPQAQASSKSVSQAARAATPGDGARRPQRDAESHGHSNVNAAANAPVNAAVHAHTGAHDAAAHDTATNDGKTFPAEAYRAFEATTNDDVARKMHEAIDRSLTSALPEGMAAGARRRIGEDIFREVHAALSGDRELARQVGETLRDWRFDASARQQVVSLVSGSRAGRASGSGAARGGRVDILGAGVGSRENGAHRCRRVAPRYYRRATTRAGGRAALGAPAMWITAG